MATTISVFEHKGGVGKTTTVASLGGILASLHGKRVLLVDIDAQKNLSQTFGVDGVGAGDSVCVLFEWLRTHTFPARLPIVHIREGLDLIPADDTVCRLDMMYGGELGRESVLRRAVALVAGDYDYVILDSPAQIGMATTNALTAADAVIIPVVCDGYSMSGLKQTLDLIEGVRYTTNPSLKIAGYLRTRFQRRRVADSEVGGQLAADFGDDVFRTGIRECSAIVQASMLHMDVLSFDGMVKKRSNATEDYVAFTRELLTRLEGWGL